MKIVINICFGGFSLSPKAIAHYLKLMGDECFFYEQTAYSFREGRDLYEKKSLLELNNDLHSLHVSTIDLGASFEKYPRNSKGYFYHRDINRDDLLLIETVESIGCKESSGMCASLTVVEVPDGINWEIQEYDGNEHIAETHRTWS